MSWIKLFDKPDPSVLCYVCDGPSMGITRLGMGFTEVGYCAEHGGLSLNPKMNTLAGLIRHLAEGGEGGSAYISPNKIHFQHPELEIADHVIDPEVKSFLEEAYEIIGERARKLHALADRIQGRPRR